MEGIYVIICMKLNMRVSYYSFMAVDNLLAKVLKISGAKECFVSPASLSKVQHE
jgi:hypothetical protein